MKAKKAVKIKKHLILSSLAKLFFFPLMYTVEYKKWTRVLKLFMLKDERDKYYNVPSKDIPEDVNFIVVVMHTTKMLINNKLFNKRVDWVTLLRCECENCVLSVTNYILYELFKYIYTTGNSVQVGKFLLHIDERGNVPRLQILIREPNRWRDMSFYRDKTLPHYSYLVFSKEMLQHKRRVVNTKIHSIT